MIMARRAGAALIEILVGATLSAIVVGAAVLLLQTLGAVGNGMTTRSERLDAARAGFAIIRSELRHVTAADTRAIARDSITSRIFRGRATVCGYNSADVFVQYQGLRLPDPAKDSALQLGPENVVAIGSVRADTTACLRTAGEQILAIRWAAPPRIGSSWLIFENGGYHLSTHALRYRQGSSSRQPITNDVIDDARSSFAPITDSVLRGIDVLFRDRHSNALSRMRLTLPNAQ